ncbi:hypothetical protein [Sphingomonas oligoaromativorans]|uniref:hypothetical protein n=1 Tax=Sphingomonas oligoaromativorans TaxID=575322 RepID=UPI001421E8A2|nr:hypothetical protein [Sphingomonas oligoaromativorans]NIJ35297.1 hypothetical protein [Sphingomonas oligoaromativorans]
MDDKENTQIAERLHAPPVRPSGRVSATALVRRHYDEIMAVCQKGRRGGKTWAEIGRDLRPLDPVSAGTVGRAFARVTAERGKMLAKATPKRVTSVVALRPAEEESLPQTEPVPARRNPFARAVDPIRLEGDE